MENFHVQSRAFVTGGAGYVGQELTNQLLEAGYQVLVYDNLSVGSVGNLDSSDSNLVFVHGDVTDCSKLKTEMRSFQPTVVFHLSAIHYIPTCINNPDLTYKINVEGTQNVIEAICDLQVRPLLVYTSSASVYGAVTSSPQPTTATPQPCDVYGQSKLTGEQLVTERLNNYIIARLFNVFGKSDPTPHLIPTIVKQLHTGYVELGNATNSRDFIYVEDAARAFKALAEQGHNKHIYNIGSGNTYSVQAVCKTLQELSGMPVEYNFLPYKKRMNDPTVLCADIQKIRKHTSWRPTTSLETGLQTVLDHSLAAVSH